jgi:hypothetical protein
MKIDYKHLILGVIGGALIMFLLVGCTYTTYEQEIHKPIHNIYPIEQTDPFEEAYA